MKFPTFPNRLVLFFRVGIVSSMLAASACLPRVAWAQPDNDLLAEAQEIGGASGTVFGNTFLAGEEVGEPNHAGNSAGSSIWFAWTAPADGVAIFDTINSDYDSLLAAYAGTDFPNLAVLAFNDDIQAGFLQSRITFGARAGVRYLIVVDGFNGEEGNVEMHWILDPPPANDNFADAQEITGTAGVYIGSNIGGTKEEGESNHAFNAGNASVWLRWTAPANGQVQMNTINSLNTLFVGMDTLLGVYTGDSVDALTLVATNDNFTGSTRSRVTFNAVSGTTYKIVLDGAYRVTNSFQGRVVLNWGMFLPPTNNTFATAQNIAGECGTLNAHNLSATKEAGEPNHGGLAGGGSVWFNWTAPTEGPVVFTTFISPFFNTLLGVYTGNAPNALSLVVSNDNLNPNNINSRVEFNATFGTTYRIAVDGASAAQYPFTLSWGQGTPLNNEFIDAILLEGNSGNTQGCTFNATKDFGEPDHAGDTGGKSIWYLLTPAESGVATIDLAGSLLDTLLGVYTGFSVDALSLVADNDDAAGSQQSRVQFPVEAAVNYYIAVDGFAGADGIVKLAWDVAPPPQIQITREGENITLTWSGPYRIESANAIANPTVWFPVNGTSPLTLSADQPARFFRAVFP